MTALRIQGRIEAVKYTTSQIIALDETDYKDLNVNDHSTILIAMDDQNKMALSRWTGPKRTRTYPFASVYDTYGFSGKRITVIPIIKDEGSDTNNDRINFITLSWMNLLNVYIILAWYEAADKRSKTRITNQSLNNEWVLRKIREISNFQLDAHHWNNEHFINDFSHVLNKAVNSYQKIEKELNVTLHRSSDHYSNFINNFYSFNDINKISLPKFAEYTLKRSRMAAAREVQTIHELELLQDNSIKAVFELRNNLGGEYFLTADDVYTRGDTLIIQEANNSTKSPLPSNSDLKDGLFKIILYSNLHKVIIGDKPYPAKAQIRLTGIGIQGKLQLPDNGNKLEEFVSINCLSETYIERINWLNEEAKLNRFQVIIESN